MKLLLDTNICIAFLHRGEEEVIKKFKETPLVDLTLCSVVKAELIYGAMKSQKIEENLSRLRIFFSSFESLFFDDQAAEYYGKICAQLVKQGTPIGVNDLLIASIALSNNLAVITRNRKEFMRVPGLKLEIW